MNPYSDPRLCLPEVDFFKGPEPEDDAENRRLAHTRTKPEKLMLLETTHWKDSLKCRKTKGNQRHPMETGTQTRASFPLMTTVKGKGCDEPGNFSLSQKSI